MDPESLRRPGDLVVVSADPIDPTALVARVVVPAAGAVVLFLGTVRDHSADRRGVVALEYEAYTGVVEESISSVVGEARDRWPLLVVAVAHRTGRLAVGEASVGVAVSAAHRPEAFDAARYLIDELKQRAPIWKKEIWEEGEEWVSGAGSS
ncbi:MAG: molybdenum cofactor biosynthesis protein MoaE [Acidimicrobiia bacterium]